ncbi:MAG: T9SS type A sorting domain-containing protein [Saonia sp.]
MVQNYNTYIDTIRVAGADITEIVVMAKQVFSTVTFVVTDSKGANIANASIDFNGRNYVANNNGVLFVNNVIPGTYRYTVTAQGFNEVSGTTSRITADTTLRITLNPVYSVLFRITDGVNPIEAATVTFNGIIQQTGTNGTLTMNTVSAGTYSYTITAQGFEDVNGTITLIDTDVTENLSMTAILTPVYQVSFYINNGTNIIANATIDFDGKNYGTNANGVAIINNLAVGSYNYTISAQGFEDVNGTITITNVDIIKSVTITNRTHTIRGRLTDAQGHPLIGVLLNGLQNTSVTDTNGQYVATEVAGWSGSIRPELQGYIFSPTVITLTNLQEDQVAKDFVGTRIAVAHTISGKITDETGKPLLNVSINGFPDKVLTDADGNFSAIQTSGWTGTLVPQLQGYAFAPESIQINDLRNDETGKNFVGSPTLATHVISGRVLDNEGNPLSDIALNGFTLPIATATDGRYSATEAKGWSGTIMPQSQHYTFAPASLQINDLQSDTIEQDFRGTLIISEHTISGKVTDSEGNPLENVQIMGPTDTIFTDKNGFYILTAISGWSGTIYPEITGHLFIPESVTISGMNRDMQQDFKAVPNTVDKSTDMIILPNPSSSGEFTVAFPNEGYVKTIQIFNVSGLLVNQFQINKELSEYTITNTLPSGFYLIKVLWDDVTYEKKILIN